MNKKQVKEYLKTQYNLNGFIEHTLVAEMCLNFHNMMIIKGQSLPIDSVSQRSELLTDFLKDFFKGTHDVSDEDIRLKVEKYLSVNCG